MTQLVPFLRLGRVITREIMDFNNITIIIDFISIWSIDLKFVKHKIKPPPFFKVFIWSPPGHCHSEGPPPLAHLLYLPLSSVQAIVYSQKVKVKVKVPPL